MPAGAACPTHPVGVHRRAYPTGRSVAAPAQEAIDRTQIFIGRVASRSSSMRHHPIRRVAVRRDAHRGSRRPCGVSHSARGGDHPQIRVLHRGVTESSGIASIVIAVVGGAATVVAVSSVSLPPIRAIVPAGEGGVPSLHDPAGPVPALPFHPGMLARSNGGRYLTPAGRVPLPLVRTLKVKTE